MRVIVLVKATPEEESAQPRAEDMAEMGEFNDKLVEAGVMLTANGLSPSSQGKRVAFDLDGNATVIDGPFAEAKELVAGFWIWQVDSLDDAVAWIQRSPFRDKEIELRQVMESEDFGDQLPPEVREAEARLREKLAARQ